MAVRIGGFDVRTGGKQLLQHLHIADDRGFGHGRRAEFVLRSDARASRDEAFHEVGIVVVHRPVQGGGAVGGLLVGVRARVRFEQRTH